ncbi:MAG: hypothetical protein HQL32_03045 [Planctomycetes bacterium]|nr:hypothetical protein [Planctomycetota bacterium]
MVIKLKCTCGAKIAVKPSMAGRKVLCPHCNNKKLIPKKLPASKQSAVSRQPDINKQSAAGRQPDVEPIISRSHGEHTDASGKRATSKERRPSLNKRNNTSAQQRYKKKKKKKVTKYVLLGAIALTVSIGLYMAYYFSNKVSGLRHVAHVTNWDQPEAEEVSNAIVNPGESSNRPDQLNKTPTSRETLAEPSIVPASTQIIEEVIDKPPGSQPEKQIASTDLSEIKNRKLTIAEALQPYEGPSEVLQDNQTLYKKVMCGYQGWFKHKDDGYGDSRHWGNVLSDPARCTVDLWPETKEMLEDELYNTNYKHSDGSMAHVFSTNHRRTVLRHFKWMKDYGIDGVFKQRFGASFSRRGVFGHSETDLNVLTHVREGANRYGRVYAIMYDVHFGAHDIENIMKDWSILYNEMNIGKSPAYIHHKGGPVVSLWGYADRTRAFDPVATEKLFKFLKSPENGACTIMVGVPDNSWSSWKDDRMRLVKQYVDIVSPWTVGRYRSPQGVKDFFKKMIPKDLAICKKYSKDYYPVIFPGFSWSNLKPGSPLNVIPRLQGEFFWTQIKELKRYDIPMIYVAMFDEVDEGTAIFKCTNNPPVGIFATYEGMPSDFYLRLTGLASQQLKGSRVSFPDVRPKKVDYKPQTELEYYYEPQYFDTALKSKWQQGFGNIPIVSGGAPHNKWVFSVNNAHDVLNFQSKSWDYLANSSNGKSVMLYNYGKGHSISKNTKADLIDSIQNSLNEGGVFVVMSDASIPLKKSGKMTFGKDVGVNLLKNNYDKDINITIPAKLLGARRPWVWKGINTKVPRCGLMSRDLYPNSKYYQSLVEVKSKDGEVLGDAAALVIPGGRLGKGLVVYIGSTLMYIPAKHQKSLMIDILNRISQFLGQSQLDG